MDDEPTPLFPSTLEEMINMIRHRRLINKPSDIGVSMAFVDDVCRRIIALEERDRHAR
jgi:hypothetical protein